MKKYNVYYTITKAGQKPITKYYWLDATSEKAAILKANDKGKEWEQRGYAFSVKYAEISNWFAI